MEIERVIYMGTAPIAVPALTALAAQNDVEVVAVCTQPDRPSGRKRKLTPSPVKVRALELGLTVLDPEKIGEVESELAALKPNLGIVFAYGQYLPRAIFDLPTLGSINFHPSRLPEYRGASPIQSTLLDGKTESALSVLQVGAKMDAGDLWLQKEVKIFPEDTSETLQDRFGQLAGEVLPELLDGLRSGRLTRTPQDESRVIECGKISKADGGIDWTKPAEQLWNQIRAFQPWPGAFFPLEERGLVKIQRARVEAESGTPGEVLEGTGGGPLIACGEGALRLLILQPPGKRPMAGADFLRGHPLPPGEILEPAPSAS
jgi:methionyl-tRNA formyltransferase